MSGAWAGGKGDTPRRRSVPHEVYDLNYNLLSGVITREEYDVCIDEAWKQAEKRGWKRPI